MVPNLLLLIFISFCATSNQVSIDWTEVGKACIQELGLDKEVFASLVVDGVIAEDNQFAEQYFGCRLRSFISDSNTLIADSAYVAYVGKVFEMQLDGNEEMARRLAEEFVEHCKDKKGKNKGETAVRVTNCLMEKFKERTANM